MLDELEKRNIHIFLERHHIRNEQGVVLDFKDHPFLWDIYEDLSPKQVILKAAQIGLTTLQIIKSLWVARFKGIDIIYTLPTESDVQQFAGGKVNRIIAQNPVFQEWVKDKDSVEQKAVGDNLIYYRGTFTQKAAIMVSSDLNIYDEVDASKQDVIEQYATRLQHSKTKGEWFFSHPSAEQTGVDKYWGRSDQKHWFIKCPSCSKEQYLSYPESIDENLEQFVCKHCKAVLPDDARRKGRWVKKYKEAEFSGYWIPLLICPWISAKEILNYRKHKSEEYFWNKVLGLPYVGGGNKLTKAQLMRNLTEKVNQQEGRIVIGIDTGKKLHYVCGNQQGLFYYDETTEWAEIEKLLNRWPRSIAVIDQGGDLIGPRALREKYPGRVFLCSYGEDRKTQELVRWGKRDEDGAVIADRNRMLQLVVDEFTDGRVPLQGTENDWYDYYLHWSNLTRIKEENERGMLRKIWVRNGDDHWAHATAYWRVGMSRFATSGRVLNPDLTPPQPNSYEIEPGQVASFNPQSILPQPDFETENDWRA